MNSFFKFAGNLSAILLLIAATAYVAFGAGRKVGRVERLFDRPRIIKDESRPEVEPPVPPVEAYQELNALDQEADSGHLANSKGW